MDITEEILRSWGASQDLRRRCVGKTASDIAGCAGLSNAEKVWVLLRVEFLGKGLCSVVERILSKTIEAHALHCQVPGVEQWAQGWISGEDRTEAGAEAAAVLAGRYSRDAAKHAARAAVCFASPDYDDIDAVRSAATAAHASARNAYDGTRAEDAARALQLAVIVDTLTGEGRC